MVTVADPLPYFAASAVSSFVTFPVWKAATIGQSGFGSSSSLFWEALKPPYRGSFAVVSGKTWAQALIFFGSDKGSTWLRHQGWGSATSSTLPPLLISAYVQITNQPLDRGSESSVAWNWSKYSSDCPKICLGCRSKGHVGGVPAANRFNAWECLSLNPKVPCSKCGLVAQRQ
eukprot:g30717.t1